MAHHSLDLLVRKLSADGIFPPADLADILTLPVARRVVPPSTYLMREGEPVVSCSILVTGMAYRHKIAFSGARQIVSLHIPGEPLDFQSLYLDHVDHNVQTLKHAELAVVPIAAIRELVARRPVIAAAVVRHLLVEASILREWMLNIGRRTARERLAHLLCEYACRLDAQGLSNPGGYELKMTQEQMGDALGLTPVHISRSLRMLEAEALIQREGRRIRFPNVDRLRKVADFSELYLHQQGADAGVSRRCA